MGDLTPQTPRPSAASIDKAAAELHRVLGASKVLSQTESCENYSRDDSPAKGIVPGAVVLAETSDDIVKALEIARKHGVPVTPRSGGTGRVGGAVPVVGGIVLTTLGMNQIKEVDRREQLAVVEPGVILADLHRAAEEQGLFYPPDANSLLACTLGGNAASNAGGPRAFKYGVTRNYVLGLDAMLMGGQRFFAGRRTTKGVTGYDVAGLLVGSEGTLGIFGDITLRLIPKPESAMTLLALFDDVHHSGRCVESIIASGVVPCCIELLDSGTLSAIRAAGNPIDAGAHAMLLMDLDGNEAEVARDAQRISDICDDVKVRDVLAAQDKSQRDRLWAARREMSPAVKRMAKHKLSEDVVVPRQQIGELLNRVERYSKAHSVRSVTYGHAGDGNLHVNYLWDDDSEVPQVRAAIEQLFRDVVELRGTLTGEHGVGVMKAPYLHLEQNSDLILLQKQLKAVFDPEELLNPGKIFPMGHQLC